ncbi:exported hypothetical protein [Xanthomonas citri pv. citri]|uniref:Uncharacterized protein n=1 Tax=Xanthomonas citri pv. citri TaxID=611301 RepID=A0A0U5FK87_XANCI|nr:exported hypothetical protein [Xanthomonas citri pv. citri]CEE17272.1 exported hypothetical protein [Xanthomonas citri pv. citri]CEE21033.1 exported hypothetical protein [Xanthomonas citri pv. citri]CEE22142.1 exported hypothetical protein [Xanthomonas citri pv. citri]CEE23234.1 exported hypothetical protein [Xanthomonas citri pv. citri]
MPRATCCCATCTTCAIALAVSRPSCWTPITAKRCGRCSKRANCARTARSPGASNSTPAAPMYAPSVPRSKMRARKISFASKAAKPLPKTTISNCQQAAAPAVRSLAAQWSRCSAANSTRGLPYLHRCQAADPRVVAYFPGNPGLFACMPGQQVNPLTLVNDVNSDDS